MAPPLPGETLAHASSVCGQVEHDFLLREANKGKGIKKLGTAAKEFLVQLRELGEFARQGVYSWRRDRSRQSPSHPAR